MSMQRRCRREIVTLHEVFLEWFRGVGDPDGIPRVERALADSFEQVAPDGTVKDRETVLADVRSAHGGYDPEFTIDVRAVEPIEIVDDRALMRYEEWQTSPTGTTGRLSTAWFGSATDAPEGVEWRHLQETWIEPPP